MLVRKFLLLLVFLFPVFSFAQLYPDKIYTKAGMIQCRIRNIDSTKIYFKYPKGEWINHKALRLDSIESYYWVSKKDIDSSSQPHKIRISHLVGGGIQLLPRIEYAYGDNQTEITYKNPLPFLFYRFCLSRRKENNFCLTLNAYERKGYGFRNGGGLGGGYTIYGTFDLLRLNVGINQFWGLGKDKMTSFGLGGSIGFASFIKTDLTHYSWELLQLGQKDTTWKAAANEAISPINLALSFELNRQIKILNKHILVLGIRELIETPEAFSGPSGGSPLLLPRAQRIFLVFLAYKFTK